MSWRSPGLSSSGSELLSCSYYRRFANEPQFLFSTQSLETSDLRCFQITKTLAGAETSVENISIVAQRRIQKVWNPHIARLSSMRIFLDFLSIFSVILFFLEKSSKAATTWSAATSNSSWSAVQSFCIVCSVCVRIQVCVRSAHARFTQRERVLLVMHLPHLRLLLK